ncbi:DUF6705 family protein [Chryseobacterium rhizosphaerae]|uniref:DUF6705 domain-containing protein n=1 Tax=Chryseobacterium rhizosphaerae TaxID=395937 RepID=A0ABX9IGJ9_9FLAO|nr:DUF6705 family protein [Chryseobacterium rhizosphaerae]REC73317.1 hypothetical protein DRF57_17530 [Chryseobacterium rhizosphaerae]GEN66065.1 hypothetical protein CRH01_06330 [Chryseobacterium rhizosphaerae]
MKNKIVYTLLILGIVSCRAQTISLDQLSQCENKPDCPDYVYLKDTNNRLNKFVGIWKGAYTDGRTYEFHFIKKENDGGWFNEKFWDRIIGRFIAKDNVGNIIYSSMNNNDLNSMSGYYFDKNLIKYQMYYSGNAECNDKGYVYLSFPDPSNLNQMKLVFMQDMDIIASCPNGYKTVIPDAKGIILIKQ